MKEVGKTWQLGDLLMAVTKDSEDYYKPRIGQLAVLDTLYTEQHAMGTESQHRDLTAYILSGYENGLLPMIEAGGYNTLISDQGEEGEYYLVACTPTHKQALNKPYQVYETKLELRKESPPVGPSYPSKVWVGTTSGGAYYTSTYTGPDSGTQPAWTAYNTGLPSNGLYGFAVSNNGNTQYALVNSPRNIYKRTSGSWSLIYDGSNLPTDTGQSTARFIQIYNDPITDILWALIDWADTSKDTSYIQWVAKYDGASWTLYGVTGTGRYHRAIGMFQVINDYIIASRAVYAGAFSAFRGYVSWSTDGASWTQLSDVNGLVGFAPHTQTGLNLYNSKVYRRRYQNLTNRDMIQEHFLMGSNNIKTTTHGYTTPWDNITVDMWQFHPTDTERMRLITGYSSALRDTSDNWATKNSRGIAAGGVSGRNVTSLVPRVHDEDFDMMIYGARDLGTNQPHCILSAYGDNDTSPTGKAGSLAGTSPYTDSIPYTSGGPCRNGIQTIYGS